METLAALLASARELQESAQKHAAPPPVVQQLTRDANRCESLAAPIRNGTPRRQCKSYKRPGERYCATHLSMLRFPWWSPTDDAPNPAQHARNELAEWAASYARRDELIRSAHAAGVGVNEIARITGIAKTTVLRVLHPAS